MTARDASGSAGRPAARSAGQMKAAGKSAGLHGAGRAVAAGGLVLAARGQQHAERRASRHDRQHRRLCRRLETRLTALISRVEGAGKTAVMVTLESGSESIYATDTDSDGSSTHVLLGSGKADGLVETVETPRVLGVAVVCEGGGSAAVQSRVTALVQALTGIGTNHITVAKMASAN